MSLPVARESNIVWDLHYAGKVWMELRHLRYFEAVARELNFSRAAAALNISQPPLSRQVQQLEFDLGAQLFDRTVRPMQLTPAGRFLYDQTVQLLARVDEIGTGVRQIAEGQRAWFGIGFVPTALYGLLPDLLRRFRATRPDVGIGLSELTTLQQVAALKSGRIDVGFGRLDFGDPKIASEVVLVEALVAVLPVQHRLAAASQVDLDALAGEPLILYPARPRPSYADRVVELFALHALRPPIAFEVNEMQTAIGLVAAGAGVTLVPESARRLRRDDVAYLPLSNVDATSPIVMACRAADASPLLATFRQLVREAAA